MISIKQQIVIAAVAIAGAFSPFSAQSAVCNDPTPQVLEDGYCQDGYEVPALITYSTYMRTQPIHTIGRALYYAPGVMEYVAEHKGYDTSHVDGLVSLLSPSTVGWTFYIKAPTIDRWLLVMNVDAAAQQHYYPHIVFSDSPIEFSYPLAQMTGLIDWTDPETGDRYFDVQICLSLQPELDCADTPVDYERWFLETVEYQ